MIILHKNFSYINGKSKETFLKQSELDFNLKGDVLFITEEDRNNFIGKLIYGLKNKKVIVFIPSPLCASDFKKDLIKSINLNHKNSSDNIMTTHFVLFTSGTTGKPKQILHSIQSLTSKIKPRKQNYIWGLTYDPFRMAGLQVILSAITNGDKVIMCDSNDIAKNVDFFVKNNVDSISATPSYFRMFLSQKKAKEIELKQITIGGEIANQNLLDSLKYNYPDSRITHIYASTEMGAAFSVNDFKEGFPSAYLANPHYAEGKLLVENNELCFKNQNEVYQTGDMVKQIGDRFIFTGRKDSIINIGGNKISLDKIENVIVNLDFVENVICNPAPHPILNNVINAKVKLCNLKSLSSLDIKKLIRKECISKLPKFAIPTKIEIVDNIELSSNSKIKRTL